ncbi:hypothetical protein WN51_10073 [Melipona quadrifasciata]|uniref:Elongator complex protein 5 n=1 Tax=Melipona quadrifasciata TaxID=166423 RepID=A0A0M9A7U6_9HYME|nr:hypothetical protein WN51_10073 [Melipona quadrifasciata]
MTFVKTLPLSEGTKLIILDEEATAMHARKLIAGWIQTLRERDASRAFSLLLFSDSKSSYQNEPKPFALSNVNIFDYYTINVDNKFDPTAVGEKDLLNLKHILQTVNAKHTVIVDCLTSLNSLVGLSKTMWFVERLSKQVPQVICIYKRDFVHSKISGIETLGSTYVKIQKSPGATTSKDFNYRVELLHRKVSGGVLRQQEIVSQNNVSYEIESRKLEQSRKLDPVCEDSKSKIESSFRIEISENEMKQKQELTLPYMINTNAVNTSKIHYHPEDIDDFDEEDPDDDLCF